MTREQIEDMLRRRELQPPRTAEELIALLQSEVDLCPVPLSAVPELYRGIIRRNAYHCYRNEALGLAPDTFRFSVFEVVPNEKSGIFYRAGYSSGRIGVAFEHKTGWCGTNCNLLSIVLLLWQGISAEDIAQKNWIYQTYYHFLFDSLNDALQMLDMPEEANTPAPPQRCGEET